MAKSQPKEKEKEESICIGSVDPRQASHEEVGSLPGFRARPASSRVHVEEPNNKQRSGERALSSSPSPSPCNIAWRIEEGRDSAPASRLASSFAASRGAKGLVSPRRAVYRGRVQAAVRNFLERESYDFASERAFNVGRERERKHKARFRGELRLNVLACPLAPSQTSRLGLNFDSELRKSLFSFGGRRL